MNRTTYIPVDYAILHEKQANGGKSAILFVQLIQAPSNSIQLKMTVYDLFANKVILTETETIPGKPNKSTYSLYLYHFFNKFN